MSSETLVTQNSTPQRSLIVIEKQDENNLLHENEKLTLIYLNINMLSSFQIIRAILTQ